MIKLRITIGDAQEVCEFPEAAITIGRSDGNLIQLDSKNISRNHATIERVEQGYKVRDLGSRNGIFVNQNRVEFALLAPGDVIKVGDALFFVEECPKPKKRTWRQPVPAVIPAHESAAGEIPGAAPDPVREDDPIAVDPEGGAGDLPGEAAEGAGAAAQVQAESPPAGGERPPLRSAESAAAAGKGEIPADRGDEMMTLDSARRLAEALSTRCRAIVRGRDEVFERVLIALFCGGHVLLDDYAGSGANTLAKALADSLVPDELRPATRAYGRVTGTPDLLPADVAGGHAPGGGGFRPGAIFANIVFVEDFPRAAAKAQALLLEAMEDKQVTVEGETHRLEDLFCVIATENLAETDGTRPLTPAQRDRFLFRLPMLPLSAEMELQVLRGARAGDTAARMEKVRVRDVVDARPAIFGSVDVPAEIHRVLVDLSQAIRQDPRVAQGIATGALVLAVPALQVRALIQGRAHVEPEDVGALAGPLFGHRVILKPGATDSGLIVAEAAARVVRGASPS